MTGRRTFQAGAAFRNGKLYEFSRDGVIVMKGWPEMRAWQWTSRSAKPWRCIRPRLEHVSLREIGQMPDPNLRRTEANGQMLFPFAYTHTGARAYHAFWWSVPRVCREWVMPFRDRRWHMLALLARCPGADDLIASNPALAFCLASNWAFRNPAVRQPMRAARSLVYKKQRRIQDWLGFPATEGARQILRRIPPESLTVPFMLVVRGALQFPEWSRRLSFMSRITEDLFRIMTTPELSVGVTFSFLMELAYREGREKYPGLAVRFQDTLRMGRMLERKIPRLRTVDQMNELHDDLVFDLNLREERNQIPFPEPPVPGQPGEIEPLTTCRALAEEGRRQGHCIASYAESVRRGTVYVYRMLKPERATLTILPIHRTWVLGEIHGFHNARVLPATCQAARDWLHARQVPDRPGQLMAQDGPPPWEDDLPF